MNSIKTRSKDDDEGKGVGGSSSRGELYDGLIEGKGVELLSNLPKCIH